MDVEFAVRYPFSSEARKVLQDIEASWNEPAMELGIERIKKALGNKLGRSTAMHREEQLEEIVAYAAARLLLGHVRNRFITNTFAVAEAKRASQYFHQEKEGTLEVLGEELGCVAHREETGYWIALPQYVRFAPGAPPYKLVNRRLQQGKVFVNRHERLRLLEEAVRLHVGRLRPVLDSPPSVKKAGEQLKKIIPPAETPSIAFQTGSHPPCIQQLLEDLKRHENLPHHARWYLAVYLLHTGMVVEQLISLYSNLPDFNEKITRYQIEHAQKKGYSIPTCATVKSWGISCPGCRRKSPLQWPGLRQGGTHERKGKKPDS